MTFEVVQAREAGVWVLDVRGSPTGQVRKELVIFVGGKPLRLVTFGGGVRFAELVDSEVTVVVDAVAKERRKTALDAEGR